MQNDRRDDLFRIFLAPAGGATAQRSAALDLTLFMAQKAGRSLGAAAFDPPVQLCRRPRCAAVPVGPSGPVEVPYREPAAAHPAGTVGKSRRQPGDAVAVDRRRLL